MIKVGERVKINKDIPGVDGMLREGTIVKIDSINELHIAKTIRVIDNLGKIWHVKSTDLDDS